MTLLSVHEVEVTYRDSGGLFGAGRAVAALKRVSLEVGAGECVGVVGESGSGKSTLAALVIGLASADHGRLTFEGREIGLRGGRRALALRRAIQLVQQDPFGSLNPTRSVEAAVLEGPRIHRLGGRAEQRDRARAALQSVGLGPEFWPRRPHQLSGGQRQRVAIARALAVDPALIILDEPTSALDLLVQAQILNLLLKLQAERGLSFLLISHDLDVVRHMTERVYVLCAGEVVEHGATAETLSNPAHPYTRRLVAAAPETRW